jgi:hypothetical protein
MGHIILSYPHLQQTPVINYYGHKIKQNLFKGNLSMEGVIHPTKSFV